VAHERAVQAGDALHVLGYEPDVVRHHDDGHAFIELSEELEDVLFRKHVDVRGRLIEDEQSWVRDQRARHEGTLQLAS
jgi:hypothetical protein